MRAGPVLPQHGVPGEAPISGVEWLFEPFWPGERLMARLADGRVTLTDEHGDPAGSQVVEAADELLAAVDADAAVIDGIWTGQPFVGDPLGARQRGGAEMRRAFVAVDLVELEGQPLADVPFGERRRLLISVVDENVRVRVSPAVRLPLEAWLAAWRASGFTRYVAKHENSRYRAGARSDEWLIVSSEPGGRRSRATRLIAQRPARPRRSDG